MLTFPVPLLATLTELLVRIGAIVGGGIDYGLMIAGLVIGLLFLRQILILVHCNSPLFCIWSLTGHPAKRGLLILLLSTYSGKLIQA